MHECVRVHPLRTCIRTHILISKFLEWFESIFVRVHPIPKEFLFWPPELLKIRFLCRPWPVLLTRAEVLGEGESSTLAHGVSLSWLGFLGTDTCRSLLPLAQGVVSTISGTRSWLGHLRPSSCSMLTSALTSPCVLCWMLTDASATLSYSSAPQ